MRNKYYLGVDGYNIDTINYMFTDKNTVYDKNEYSELSTVACGGESGAEIFEKYGIPKHYQKMYMVANPIRVLVSIPTMSMREKINVFQRFTAKEVLTGMPIYLTNVSGTPIYIGYMATEKPAFELSSCHECDRNKVINFYRNLKAIGLLDKYLEALGEIMHLGIKIELDESKTKKIEK